MPKSVIYMLVVSDVTQEDNGNYGCHGENVITAAEMVHINSGSNKNYPGTPLLSVLCILSFLRINF